MAENTREYPWIVSQTSAGKQLSLGSSNIIQCGTNQTIKSYLKRRKKVKVNEVSAVKHHQKWVTFNIRTRFCYWGNVLIFIRLEAQVFSICCFLQIFYVFHIYSLLTFLWLSAFHVSDRLGATRNWEILFASTRFFCFFNPDCNIFSSDILLLLLLSKWFCFSNLSKI